MPKVTKIEATVNPITRLPNMSLKKRRVAGYARVSTDSDEQFTSYEAQVDYYTRYITNIPEWQFVTVYTDEGITGTNTKKREGFNTMIDDALSGKIDLIITKSVSRFARNTVDSLVTIRKLKEKGVEVYFEKENIYTFDGKGELLLTIMSSLAQEEARSISENVTWGQRKRFADGKVSLPYAHFLGYEKGEDGTPAIVEKEAKIVREIYKLFLLGNSVTAICRHLENKGIKTPAGKDRWRESTIFSILRNEKYKGDALLQKEFTVDFLQKKKKKNEGEVPQYYVTESHPAIISPDEFDMIQLEIERRGKIGKKYSGTNILSSRIVCGDCGGFYGSKVWHSNDKYRKVIWQCNNKFNGDKCSTPTLDEKSIKEAFIKAYNTYFTNKNEIIENCEMLLKIASDTSKLDKKISAITKELESISTMVSDLINKNATSTMSQEQFYEKYNTLTEKYEKKEELLNKLNTEKQQQLNHTYEITAYVERLKTSPDVLYEWDDLIWIVTINKAIVYHDGKITFEFKDGSKTTI